MRRPPEPRPEDLELKDWEIFVVWLSGDLDDRPALMSIKEFCAKWCPRRFEEARREAWR